MTDQDDAYLAWREGRPNPDEPTDPMLVMLHPAIVPPFTRWLAAHDLRLGKLPDGLTVSVDGQPTWIVTPGEL